MYCNALIKGLTGLIIGGNKSDLHSKRNPKSQFDGPVKSYLMPRAALWTKITCQSYQKVMF